MEQVRGSEVGLLVVLQALRAELVYSVSIPIGASTPALSSRDQETTVRQVAADRFEITTPIEIGVKVNPL